MLSHHISENECESPKFQWWSLRKRVEEGDEGGVHRWLE